MSSFMLKKWYLDAADEQGNVYIGYWATVQWQSLTLSYYQHLWRTASQGVTCKAALTSQPPPEWSMDSELCWNTSDVQATWQSTDQHGFSETLLHTDEGEVQWQVFQPKACAVIQSSQLSFSGWGYTECLDLSIPAWDLPLNTLYWGRCHSDNHCMVWIKWEGPTKQCLLWCDGSKTTQFALSDAGVSDSLVTLEVETRATLRQGVIGSTVFGAFAKVASLFPSNALLLDEQKWVGMGKIRAGDASEPATVIYERVVW